MKTTFSHLTKNFGATVAVDGVSFEIADGSQALTWN